VKGLIINSYVVLILLVLLLAMDITPMKFAEAQYATRHRVEVLSDAAKQKSEALKTEHPKLGVLADRILTKMNVTEEATKELTAFLDFGQRQLSASGQELAG
jgi:hypothetical protein